MLELTVILKPVILLLCLKSGVPVVIFKILCVTAWKRTCHAGNVNEQSTKQTLISLNSAAQPLYFLGCLVLAVLELLAAAL